MNNLFKRKYKLGIFLFIFVLTDIMLWTIFALSINYLQLPLIYNCIIFLFFIFTSIHPFIVYGKNPVIKFYLHLIKLIWKFLNKYRFQIFLFLIAGVLISSIVIYINRYEMGRNILDELGQKGEPFYLVNVAIAVAALGTAIFTWWKNVLSNKQVEDSQKQTEINIDERFDSLFAKAVELLNEENKLLTRQGGVHILRDLALSSPKHTQKCIDMLCSINESWMPEILKKDTSFFKTIGNDDNWTKNKITKEKLINNYNIESDNYEKLVEQILLSQLIIKYLSSIISHISSSKEYQEKYDLSYKYLCSINFPELQEGINFSKFLVNGTFFSGGYFWNCSFKDTNLSGSHFECSFISDSTFDCASLMGSIFDFGSLYNVSFKKCGFREASFKGSKLQSSHFESSNLDSTDFVGANLENSHFEGSKIWKSNFVATNLINTRFEGCFIDSSQFKFSLLDLRSLKGSEITGARENSLIFSPNLFKEKLSIFENKNYKKIIKKMGEDFDTYSQKIFLENMEKSKEIYLKNRNNNIESYFKAIKSLDDEKSGAYLMGRNQVALVSKSVARSMILRGYHSVRNEVMMKLNSSLNLFIKDICNEWYQDFVKEGIIQNDKTL
jgi:uncharacterized protein YjbI with pentapeptide repeats/nitrogen fixation-related uncharacterized protein